jgi:hypothetical protein
VRTPPDLWASPYRASATSIFPALSWSPADDPLAPGLLLLWQCLISGNGADLASRRLCKLDTGDKVPNNSTFSVNRLRRFHESEILVIFSGAVVPSLVSGFVKGEG